MSSVVSNPHRAFPVGWLISCTTFVRVGLLPVALAAGVVCAQVRRDQFVHLTQRDGLSSFRIYSVVQDSTGFLWAGSIDGLNRYDGSSFKIFRHAKEDRTSISDNIVRLLHVDAEGTLWVATESSRGNANGGLNKYHPATESFTRYLHDPQRAESIGPFSLTAMADERSPDSSGKVQALWIGTRGGGLERLNPLTGAVAHFRHGNGNGSTLCNDTVNALAADTRGRLWIGTNRGLDLYENVTGRFIHVRILPHAITALLCDQSGTLWIGTSDGRLYTANPGRGIPAPSAVGKGATDSSSITFLKAQGQRFIWVGTGNGLRRYDRIANSWTTFRRNEFDPRSLPVDAIWSLCADRSGNVWIATDKGLSKLAAQRERFQHYALSDNSQAEQVVTALVVDENDNIWIGTTQYGIRLFEPRTRRVTSLLRSAINPAGSFYTWVDVLYRDRRGTIWASGGEPNTLERYDPRRNGFIRYPIRFQILSLALDKRGVLWAGSREGVKLFDPLAGRFLEQGDEAAHIRNLTKAVVTGLADGRDSAMWICTDGDGLFKYNYSTHTITHFSSKDSNGLSSSRVYDVYEDARGNVWIATFEALNLLRKGSGTFQAFPLLTPEGRATPYRLMADDRGRLWIGTTQNGIFSFDPNTYRSKNYTAEDGLQGDVFTAAALTRSGELVEGGRGGFNIFHPDSLKENPVPPNVVITKFQLLNDKEGIPLRYPPGFAFDYDQNYLIIQFAGLEFTNPARNRFRYRMKPDAEWIDAGDQRSIILQNLADGEYLFEVMASNNDGVWSERSATYPFSVKPPFTRTWYFNVMVLAVIVSMVMAAYKYRINYILQMEQLRGRIAYDLHDEVSTSMTGIANRIELVTRRLHADSDECKSLKKTVTRTRRAQDTLRLIVSIINPEHDEPLYLVLRMKETAAELLGEIRYTIEASDESFPPALDIEFRWNLLLIYNEALNNIVRYAKASCVEIRANADDECFELCIRDDGIGFSLEEALERGGNGLQSMYNRAKKIGATLEIATSPGNGASLRVIKKIPRRRYADFLRRLIPYLGRHSQAS